MQQKKRLELPLYYYLSCLKTTNFANSKSLYFLYLSFMSYITLDTVVVPCLVSLAILTILSFLMYLTNTSCSLSVSITLLIKSSYICLIYSSFFIYFIPPILLLKVSKLLPHLHHFLVCWLLCSNVVILLCERLCKNMQSYEIL